MERKVLWGEMRRDEVAEAARAKAVVIVPVGSIEQHGRHLPLDTDTSSVYEVAVRTARATAEPWTLVTPVIPFGLSPHHLDFPGVITLRFDTLVAVLCDVCRSVHHHGFRKILILNGHGGNEALVGGVAQKLVEEKIYVAAATYFRTLAAEMKEIGRSPIGGMGHACELETSLMLALRPQLVDMSLAEDAPGFGWTSFFSRDFRATGPVAYPLVFPQDSPSGVRGMPSYATAETGEKFLAAAAAKLGQFLKEFAGIPER
ncbi:MAG: creatininase family protein [Chloroflexi bacterium]|nr:creatininase family protein [Chloroflexota bacterium]MCL5110287.1 creatininase family protein [Chloroflexota bacterium]MDA8216547.1 creatininase family protein [Dehalococcoidales bacterium]